MSWRTLIVQTADQVGTQLRPYLEVIGGAARERGSIIWEGLTGAAEKGKAVADGVSAAIKESKHVLLPDDPGAFEDVCDVYAAITGRAPVGGRASTAAFLRARILKVLDERAADAPGLHVRCIWWLQGRTWRVIALVVVVGAVVFAVGSDHGELRSPASTGLLAALPSPSPPAAGIGRFIPPHRAGLWRWASAARPGLADLPYIYFVPAATRHAAWCPFARVPLELRVF